MRSPLSPIVANIFMEDFETRALDTTDYKTKLWLRHMLQDFLPHLNSIHPKIKFTIEIENRNQLAFLEVLRIKKEDVTLGHTAYRKATHTNRYLNAQLNHHPTQIQGVAKTQVSRSQRLADADHIQTERSHQRFHHQYHKQSLPYENESMGRYQLCSQSISPLHKGYNGQKILRKHQIHTVLFIDRKIG
ncbi:hypothetical protein Trydic_g22628 [Trypoxylus dichotomus]